jgi:hypothetical protein
LARFVILFLPSTSVPSTSERTIEIFVDAIDHDRRVLSELIGREVWVRWDSRCVRIFNERMEQDGMHTRVEAGKFNHSLGAGGWSAPVLSSCRYWVSRAAVLGEPCGQWAQLAPDARGPESLRSIMGRCGLIKKHSAATLNTTCAKAIQSGTHRLRDIRRLIGQRPEQSTFAFPASSR